MKVLNLLILLILFVAPVLHSVDNDTWDYFCFWYDMPPTGTEYTIDCTLAGLQRYAGMYSNINQPWCLLANTAYEVSGLHFAGTIVIVFPNCPEWAKRPGQRVRLRLAFNGLWSVFNFPVFRCVEILE